MRTFHAPHVWKMLIKLKATICFVNIYKEKTKTYQGELKGQIYVSGILKVNYERRVSHDWSIVAQCAAHVNCGFSPHVLLLAVLNINICKGCKIAAQKKFVFLEIFALLAGFCLYQCYYSHRSRDSLSPVCGIFFTLVLWIKSFTICLTLHSSKSWYDQAGADDADRPDS